jgi:glycogen(starch) synthase
MKILHLIYDHINNPWVGGGGAFRVRELYRRMSDRHEITVVCGRYPGAEDHSEEGVRYAFVGSDRNNYVLSTFCYAARAARHVKVHAGEYDIVVEDFAPYNPVFSFLWRKDAVIQLHHREGMNLIKRYFLLGLPFALTELSYPRLFRRVICVSEASRKKFGVTGAAVIPNGIDSDLLKVSPGDGGYLSFVGRLNIHNKGIDTLIAAMKLINGELRIAGRGRDREKMILIARRMGVEGKIRLLDYVMDQEKGEFMGNSALFVLPSRYEGQGIVVLEAAACGKPVIVSDIPELRYAVNAGFGLSFRTGDAKDLAKKINVLLADPPLRREMGMRAKEYARNFTWDKIAAEYEKYLLGIVEGASPAS